MADKVSQIEPVSINSSWFIIRTKIRQEKNVALHLNRKGIETYLPEIETCTYRELKKIKTIKSLFPNYLFARCEIKNLPQIFWAKGVRKVLLENNCPVPIADELIFSLKSLADDDGLIRPDRLAIYQKNDRVLITGGPFKDFSGLFNHWESDKERVSLLLNVLSAQIRVTVPVGSITAE